MTRDRIRPPAIVFVLFLAVTAALALSGCAGAPPAGIDNQTRDSYVQAYATGIEEHAAGQDYFNNGTRAWEAADLRAAIADYANASLCYSRAAKDYGIMAGYAQGEQEKEFADSLSGCTFNLSQASDSFVNAAIALEQDDSDTAYEWFNEGQARVDASEALLNRSIAATPDWLIELASG